MQCGSKCFQIEVELDGEKKTELVRARTAVNARKAIRVQYGKDAVILSAVEDKKKR